MLHVNIPTHKLLQADSALNRDALRLCLMAQTTFWDSNRQPGHSSLDELIYGVAGRQKLLHPSETKQELWTKYVVEILEIV